MIESLYLHVPFCQSICFYCDFKRGLYNEEMANKWLEAITLEWNSKKINTNLKTIYIGGGTPTALNEQQLTKFLKLITTAQNKIEEFTIESNIESLSESKLAILNKFNVNRISLGVQSLQDELLMKMNRKHKKDDVFDMIDKIYDSGIKNISVDMIYGLENQTLEMWMNDLKTLVKIDKIKHLSLYSLTIEENTVFKKQNIQPCDNELEALMYENAIRILEENGFEQYEIANFARPDYHSRHNCTYWEYDDFYGIGLGASGKENNIRYENTGDLNSYIKNEHNIIRENLTKDDRIFENIMMSLRMRKGLDLNKFKQRYHQDIFEIYEREINEERIIGNLDINETHLFVTTKGMFYLHDILVKFLR